MSTRNKLIRIALPVVILIAGVAVMRLLVLSRPAPQKEVRSTPGALVEVLTVSREDHRIQVKGTGTVQARREANITPQVGGRITYIAPAFIAGGFFVRGEMLFEIEAVDYQLAADRARAALAQAELDLAKEESNARIARREWKRLATNNNEEPNPLVLYQPQMKKARADVSAAGAALKQAELDLQRTRIYAPFDCRIRTEEIDFGEYVLAGNSVAVVAGTETAEIVVPLPIEELRWLRIPRQGSENHGSRAEVKVTTGSQSFTYHGRVVRSLGEVDPEGRMARIVAAVDDPYHLKSRRSNSAPDLEMGMFVVVTLHGEMLTAVIPIPRRALRWNSTVWVVDGEDKLSIRPVTVVRREQETLLIGDGLKEGERVVITTVSGAANGMKLRPMEQGTGK